MLLLGISFAQAAPTVSAQAGKLLDQAAELLENRQFDRAEPLLSDLLASDSAHEQALALRLLAWTDVQRGRNTRAMGRYRDLLALPGLQEKLRDEATRNLVHLLFDAERFHEVIELLTALHATRKDSRLLLTMAQAQYKTGRHADGAASLQAAIDLLKNQGRAPDEAILRQLHALQFAAKDWAGLRRTLEQLVARFPKRSYWLHLADTWARLNRPDRQVATLELALLRGDLNSDDIGLLIRAMIAAGTPARAARLLEQHMQKGAVARDTANWKLLYHARWQARERETALDALESAATAARSGALWLELARHRIEREEWHPALQALEAAGHGNAADRAGEIALLTGIALAQTGQTAQALSEFGVARNHPEQARSAAQWLEYIEQTPNP